MSNIDLSTIYNMWGISTDEQIELVRGALKKGLDDRVAKLHVKRAQIENLQYEESLILKNLCDCLSDDVNNSHINLFNGFTSTLLDNAWTFFNYTKEKDKTKLSKSELKEYDEKESSFKYVTSIINRNILNVFEESDNRFELVELISTVYQGGYDFTYKYKDVKFTIFIPDFSMTMKENVFDMLSGYKLKYWESEHVLTNVFSSLDYREVSKETLKWLAEKGWKKHE